MTLAIILSLVLILSLSLNVFLFFKAKKRRARGPLNYDLRAFIHDLTADGGAMAAFNQLGEARHVNTDGLTMRAPKK